jgi:hypothetical protein
MFNQLHQYLKMEDSGLLEEEKVVILLIMDNRLSLITLIMTFQLFSNKETDFSMSFGQWKATGSTMFGFIERVKKMMTTLESISKLQEYLKLVFNLK